MCRLLAWVAPRPIAVAEALGHHELEGFKGLSRQHSDGWGMAWWGDPSAAAATPLVGRSTECASRDPEFDRLAAAAVADSGFVHLRWATPGLPITPANTHPFLHGQLAFAHNGAIHPQSRLDEMVPDGWASRVAGDTDSERYFIAVAQRLHAGEAMVDAVAGVVRTIFRTLAPTSLNATLLAPDALYVVSAHDPAKAPSFASSSAGDNPSPEIDSAFYDLRYRVRPDAVVVASAGFDQPDAGAWQPLGNMALLRVERGTLTTSVASLAA